MIRTEQLAEAALAYKALELRSLVRDWLQENLRISECMPPISNDGDILATAAGLVEMLALRAGQKPPSWTAQFGPLRSPRFLLKSAQTMRRLRETCIAESPLPLRRRGLYAPADFLTFA